MYRKLPEDKKKKLPSKDPNSQKIKIIKNLQINGILKWLYILSINNK